MDKLPEILWISLVVLALGGFFSVMYFGVGTFYDFCIKIKEDDPAIWKRIGFNDKYLNDRDKWIRYCRICFSLFAILLLAILILFMMMFK
jgi:hypothetical protein